MAKQTQIVCQHLENISRAALEEYQDVIRQYVRKRHGIYALYRRGKLHYVCLASNLRVRLKQHLRDRHKDSWDRFSVYLTIDNQAIKELETLLLRFLARTCGVDFCGIARSGFPRSFGLPRSEAPKIPGQSRKIYYGLLQ